MQNAVTVSSDIRTFEGLRRRNRLRAMTASTRDHHPASTNEHRGVDTSRCTVSYLVDDVRRFGLTGTLAVWRQRLSFRRELQRLMRVAPHMIDDIGLTEEQAHAEIRKPAWLP